MADDRQPTETAFWIEMVKGFVRDLRAAVAAVLADSPEAEVCIVDADQSGGFYAAVELSVGYKGGERVSLGLASDSHNCMSAGQIEAQIRKAVEASRNAIDPDDDGAGEFMAKLARRDGEYAAKLAEIADAVNARVYAPRARYAAAVAMAELLDVLDSEHRGESDLSAAVSRYRAVVGRVVDDEERRAAMS